jgi:hypothetical protein
VCGEGTGNKVDAKGLSGPVAGEGGVIRSTEEVMRQVEIFPGSNICSWEEALDGGGARSVLIGG